MKAEPRSAGPERERAQDTQGSQGTNVAGLERARSQRGMGSSGAVVKLRLDSVEVEHLGNVLNRRVARLDFSQLAGWLVG